MAGERRTGKRKTFPLFGKANMFYFLYCVECYYPTRCGRNKNIVRINGLQNMHLASLQVLLYNNP
jgi:hypothetical protein